MFIPTCSTILSMPQTLTGLSLAGSPETQTTLGATTPPMWAMSSSAKLKEPPETFPLDSMTLATRTPCKRPEGFREMPWQLARR